MTKMKPLPSIWKGNSLKRMTPTERAYARRHTQEFLVSVVQDAAEHVYNTMMDERMPPDLRLRAAFDILDRSMGKSVNKVEQKVLDEMEDRQNAVDLTAVPTERIEEALNRVRDLLEPPVDSSPEPPDFELD